MSVTIVQLGPLILMMREDGLPAVIVNVYPCILRQYALQRPLQLQCARSLFTRTRQGMSFPLLLPMPAFSLNWVSLLC